MPALAWLAIVIQTAVASPSPIPGQSALPPSRNESSAAAGRRLRLLVRIESPAAPTGLHIADLIENIRTIWRPYAEIDFAGTGVETADGYDDELRLVISERGRRPSATAGIVLGWIEFLDGRPRNTVSVSIAGARAMMREGRWLGRAIDAQPPILQQKFVTRALSRSAAHEIGHYLLRSNAHAARGLMRERMTVEEIMDDSTALNRLQPGEIAALDQRRAGAWAEAPAPDRWPTIAPVRDRKS